MKNRKILTAVLVIICIAVLACVFSGCTKKNENMLTNDNGVFRYEKLADLQQDWILVTADTVSDVSDVFTMNANADDDKYSVTINTSETGWAYIGQKVKLTQGQYYKVNYSINISEISPLTSGEAFDGVYVTFLEDEDFNGYTGEDTDNVAQQGTMHISTTTGDYSIGFKAKSGGYATLILKVGSESGPAKATVQLNKLTVERTTKADVVSGSNNAGSFVSDYYGGMTDFNVFYIVMGSIAILLICYFAYFAIQRHLYIKENEGTYTGLVAKVNDSKILGVILVAGVALLIRLFIDIMSTAISAGFLHSIMGYNVEGLTTQAVFIAKYGTKDLGVYLGAFATENGLTYSAATSSPLQLYILGFCGLLGRMFDGIGATYTATMFFIKFICSLADIATAVLLYLIVKKSLGNVGATIVAGAYMLLPVVFATSAMWGYMDSITVFLVLLTVYYMLKQDRYVPMAITYFVACMFSMTALFIAPFVLFYTVMQCIKNVKNTIPASIILVMSFVLFYALTVPFNISFINNGEPFSCYKTAWSELYTTHVYARNAFNFQTLLGNNFAEVSTASVVVTIIFILFLLTLAGFAYFKFKNRMNLMLMATAFINMLFVFGNNMNPVSMYISLALMLLYAILNKEKRIYFSFVLFAILMFVNISYSELFVEYSSSLIGQIGKVPTMYVFSVLELLAALYYIYVVYDIVVTRKVRKIRPMPLTYSEWLTNVGRRIKKTYYKAIIKLQRSNNK